MPHRNSLFTKGEAFSGLSPVALRVTRVPVSALDTAEALAANKAFWILTALPSLWFVAEVLTMLTNEKRRALHDFIAGTVVIKPACSSRWEWRS